MKSKDNQKPQIPSIVFFKFLHQELAKQNTSMQEAIKISFKRWEELKKPK